jgi:hypothetical protein
LLHRSSYAPEVEALYREAGLNLRDDLATLAANAHITADANAIRWLDQTSVPTGRRQVPELDMHTISDQLVPVQQERYYRHTVRSAGAADLLRQAYVERQLHCNFNPAELVAGVLAVQHRVDARPLGRGRRAGASRGGGKPPRSRISRVHLLPARPAERSERSATVGGQAPPPRRLAIPAGSASAQPGASASSEHSPNSGSSRKGRPLVVAPDIALVGEKALVSARPRSVAAAVIGGEQSFDVASSFVDR